MNNWKQEASLDWMPHLWPVGRASAQKLRTAAKVRLARLSSLLPAPCDGEPTYFASFCFRFLIFHMREIAAIHVPDGRTKWDHVHQCSAKHLVLQWFISGYYCYSDVVGRQQVCRKSIHLKSGKLTCHLGCSVPISGPPASSSTK